MHQKPFVVYDLDEYEGKFGTSYTRILVQHSIVIFYIIKIAHLYVSQYTATIAVLHLLPQPCMASNFWIHKMRTLIEYDFKG